MEMFIALLVMDAILLIMMLMPIFGVIGIFFKDRKRKKKTYYIHKEGDIEYLYNSKKRLLSIKIGNEIIYNAEEKQELKKIEV